MSRHWTQRPELHHRLRVIGLGALVVSLLAPLVFGVYGYFPFTGWFGFNALLGFAVCAGLALAVGPLGRWLRRPEEADPDPADPDGPR
jgi:hypothetical protein